MLWLSIKKLPAPPKEDRMSVQLILEVKGKNRKYSLITFGYICPRKVLKNGLKD